MEYIYTYSSPLGNIMLASDGDNLTGLWFEKQDRYAYSLSADKRKQLLPVFEETIQWLDIYFSGKDPGFTPALKVNSTPFRQKVCEIMLTIPFGHTMSYGDIAKIIVADSNGQKTRMSGQAVGGAVGHNPISIIIPCHRVLGSDRSLTGYGGGLDRKVALLKLEGINYKE